MISRIIYASRARWCPTRSLLGYLFRLKVKNRKQAESWYLITISSTVVLLIVMQFLSWSLWHEEITGNPGIAMWYWICQLGGASLIFAGGGAGYCPRVKIELTESCLKVSQGRRFIEINQDALTECKIVSALQYYRNWESRADHYMTHIPEDVFLVFTGEQITAIGINPDAHAELLSMMNPSNLAKAEVPNAV